jgi:hypothetical protein
MAQRSERCRYRELASSHHAPVTMPEKVADLLLRSDLSVKEHARLCDFRGPARRGPLFKAGASRLSLAHFMSATSEESVSEAATGQDDYQRVAGASRRSSSNQLSTMLTC